MKLLSKTNEIDVNIHDMSMDIDIIFHRYITDKTGITMSHRAIHKFIIDFIRENNKKVNKSLREEKEMIDQCDKREKEYQMKIKAGKTIPNLNGIINKIKFYGLDYILIEE